MAVFGHYIFPVLFLAGGVSGAYFLGRENQIQREARGFSSSQVSVEYVIRETDDKAPVCETFEKSNLDIGKKLSEEECKKIVWDIWGHKKNQPREWIRADKDSLNDFLWRNYLLEDDDSKEVGIKKDNWKSKKSLFCTRTKLESWNKEMVSCDYQK